MSEEIRNALGQPIGLPVPGWKGAGYPRSHPVPGRYCQLRPIEPDKDARTLFEHYQCAEHPELWTYLPSGPFDAVEEFDIWLRERAEGHDPMFFAVCEPDGGEAKGLLSLMRIATGAGSIEIGNIVLSPSLQRTRAATEAIVLLMAQAFDVYGFRRLEWKCDSLNAPSRSAAQRLGFRFEGVFRQALVYKGRNRDTAWYSVIDAEWPDTASILYQWLSPLNFDSQGSQLCRLSQLWAGRNTAEPAPPIGPQTVRHWETT